MAARSAIALVRATGGKNGALFGALGRHFTTLNGSTLAKLAPRVAHYGSLSDNSGLIDDVLLTRFDAPASFTGEDSLEISCHGNPLIVRRILELLYSLGLRQAEPGEFTRRAFLNGKLSLDAAQAIGEIVEARNERSLQAAQRMQQGEFRKALYALRSAMMNLIADLNAELDFSDEDLTFAEQEKKITILQNTATQARTLATEAQRLEAFRDGVNIAIVGAPNAGKSSLLNRLIGKERSIVSPIAGTTRDYIEAEIEIAGINVRLFDTAGLRSAEAGSIEEIGIERTRELLQRAHIAIVLVDGSQPAEETAFSIAANITAAQVRVLNKCDVLHPHWAEQPFLKISAKTGEGIQELLNTLQSLVAESAPTDALPLSLWQRQLLTSIADNLERAARALSMQEPLEVVTHIVQQATTKIAELTGDITSEDILGRIFSRFCIGK